MSNFATTPEITFVSEGTVAGQYLQNIKKIIVDSLFDIDGIDNEQDTEIVAIIDSVLPAFNCLSSDESIALLEAAMLPDPPEACRNKVEVLAMKKLVTILPASPKMIDENFKHAVLDLLLLLGCDSGLGDSDSSSSAKQQPHSTIESSVKKSKKNNYDDKTMLFKIEDGVIVKVNLLSVKFVGEVGISRGDGGLLAADVFKVGQKWLNKKLLVDAVSVYSSRTGWNSTCKNATNILCSCYQKKKWIKKGS